jgi:hypothetical protein
MDMNTGETPPARSSKWRSYGVGCVAVLALGILLSILLYYWAVTPGPQLPSGSFLGSETLGVAHLQGLRGDPAVQAMTGAILRALNDLQKDQLEESEAPFLFRWLARSQGDIDDKRIDQALRDAPRDATVQLESVPGSVEPELMAVVNLNRYPRALHLAYQVASWVQGSETVAGRPVLGLGLDDSGFVVFIEDTLLWGQREEVLRLALDRRPATDTESVSSNVLATFSNRQERWNFFGTVENRQDSLAWMADKLRTRWPQIPPRPQLDEILSRINQVDFGLDVADQDSLDGFIDLVCGSPPQAEEIAGLLGAFVELSGPDPHFSLEVESHEERVRVFLHFRNFVQFVVDSIQNSEGRKTP